MRRRRHGVKLGLAVTLMLVGFMGGCGMTGTWSSKALRPEIARDEFAVIGQKPYGTEFTKAEITIHKDGSYVADVHYGDDVVESTGQWEKGQDSKVTFIDDEGASRTYDAELSPDGNELLLVRSIEGTDVELVLERQ